MKRVVLSVLLMTGAMLPGVAHAQEGAANYVLPPAPYTQSQQERGDPGWSNDTWARDPGPVLVSNRFAAGVAALEANDLALAEEIFTEGLRYNRNNVTTRFYLGVTKMKLEKWNEAKQYLRTPARDLRKQPDPKGHLGVTYVKLGDIAGANAQRAALVKMADACNGTCKLASDIQSGIKMIDEALAERLALDPAARN